MAPNICRTLAACSSEAISSSYKIKHKTPQQIVVNVIDDFGMSDAAQKHKPDFPIMRLFVPP
jgi:hypothetical protein